MPLSRATFTTPDRLQSGLVWLLAGLVFTLGLLTVSPTAHAHLHAHSDASCSPHDHAAHAVPHDDTGCAVTLFQQGVTTPLDLPRVETPRTAQISTVAPAPVAPPRQAPPHRLQPARAPPCIG